MASDQILKRAFFGGFKRECVIDYIEKLQLQLSETQNQAELYKKKYKSIKKKSDALADCQNRIEVLSSENESLKNEIEVIKSNNYNSSSLFDTKDIDTILSDTRQNRVEIEELINKMSGSTDSDSDNSDLIQKLIISSEKLLNTLNRIDYGSEFEDIKDENQFRFDIDGLEKVEEEFLNKMFIDE